MLRNGHLSSTMVRYLHSSAAPNLMHLFSCLQTYKSHVCCGEQAELRSFLKKQHTGREACFCPPEQGKSSCTTVCLTGLLDC